MERARDRSSRDHNEGLGRCLCIAGRRLECQLHASDETHKSVALGKRLVDLFDGRYGDPAVDTRALNRPSFGRRVSEYGVVSLGESGPVWNGLGRWFHALWNWRKAGGDGTRLLPHLWHYGFIRLPVSPPLLAP
jgi:hypothetical protein